MKTIVKHCPHLVNLVLANCPLITDVAMNEIATNLSAVRYVPVMQPRHRGNTIQSQRSHLLMDDSSYRLNFDLGKKNKIHHHS